MLFFDAVTLPKAVPRDGSYLRTANSMDIWNNAVAFLRAALRRTTRTLFSFQGAAVLFSLKEGKPETHGLKPTRNPPNRLGSNPAACGGFRSVMSLLLQDGESGFLTNKPMRSPQREDWFSTSSR
jgi:hypothetical protein